MAAWEHVETDQLFSDSFAPATSYHTNQVANIELFVMDALCCDRGAEPRRTQKGKNMSQKSKIPN